MSQSFVKPIAPTQSAEPTSHSKWPNTRSPPNLNRPKEGAGNKKFRIYSISSSPYKFTTIYRSCVKDTTIIIWQSIPTSPDFLYDFGLTKIKSQVRSEAAGVWWPVEADPEEEGEDDEEAGAEDGVHRVQVEEPGQLSRLQRNDSRSTFQAPIKRTKHFELGGEKKRKGQMIQF